jgi:uncharacterized surface protein with fasciclin (FAS1) repeats
MQPAAACSAATPTLTMASMDAQAGNIVQVARAAGSFTTLVAAVQAADLVDVLSGDGPFTVLAPTDEAFEALPAGTLETLLKPENKPLLRAVLLYHVIPAELPSGQVVKATDAQTAGGQRIDIDVRDGVVYVDNARVVQPDVEASNGVIHAIDAVIMPATEDLLGLADQAGVFTTLSAAIEAAGLVEALRADGPITVFAPTDEAFAALPRGTVEGLLRPENRSTLQAILKYHVVPGRVYADDAVGAGVATTLQGGDVRLRIRDGRLMVNDAAVIKSDLEATNGVVHVIDRVIMPPR